MKLTLCICLVLLMLQGSAQRSEKHDQMKFSLSAIFVEGHTLCFDMEIVNHSLLGYWPQYVRFFIRDRYVAKRTAVQEMEIFPLIKDSLLEVPAGGNQKLVRKFYQFTLPKTKELVITMKEKNGARDLTLHVNGHRLLKMIQEKNQETVFN